MMHLLTLPLDARPVCWQLPQQLAQLMGVRLHTPPKALLGNLKHPASLSDLLHWAEKSIENHPVEHALLALDTALYGGLIPSRLHALNSHTLNERLNQWFETLAPLPTSAFASIMRIPNYNNAEEEPDYWAEYGSALYALSERLHQQNLAGELDLLNVYLGNVSVSQLPLPDALPPGHVNDFIQRRRLNFTTNMALIDALQAGHFKRLCFCEDDRGRFGLNVFEATHLQHRLNERGLQDEAHVQTGADELTLSFMVQALLAELETPPRVMIGSSQNLEAHALFDGKPLADVIDERCAALNVEIAQDVGEADIVFVLHAPHERMGDHCEHLEADTSRADAERTLGNIRRLIEADKLVVLIDVSHANGADAHLLRQLLNHPETMAGLAGYSAWNTPGNAIGCGLALGLAVLLGLHGDCFDADAHRVAMATRLLDDGVYQTLLRREWRENNLALSDAKLTQALRERGAPVLQAFGFAPDELTARFPCRRTFECEIQLAVLES